MNMHKPTRTKIVTGNQLRNDVLNGVNKISDLVGATLGARGRNIALPRPHGIPQPTKDGVSVAREVYLENPSEDNWAQLLKQVAIKTNVEAGDGTTTSTVIAQAIINEGIDHVTYGSNPIEIKAGIDKAVKKVVEYLNATSHEIDIKGDEICDIATISANGDREIGNIIAEAFRKVGAEGHINVEESKTSETTLETVDGFQVESGWHSTSPYFITDFKKNTVELKNPYIYISDKKLSQWHQIERILYETLENQKRPIVFICSELEGDAFSTMMINADPAKQNRLPIAAIKAPKFGKERSDMLEDIAIMTGGTVVSDTKGTSFDKITVDKLGQCEKIVISRRRTNIIKGAGNPKLLENRKDELRGAIKSEKDDVLKEQYKNRLGKLNGSIAILNVGAASNSEVKEKKDRIEDAINATRAAIEEGIVPGGGLTLYQASRRLSFKSRRRDEQVGMQIVKKALTAPIVKILENAGYGYNKSVKWWSVFSDRSMVDDILDEINRTGLGYDVRNERFVNMVKEGIIDPKKVTRIALENAAGVAGLILTTEGSLIYVEENEKKANG